MPADTDGPVFRPAGPTDVSDVVELVQTAYRGESSRAGWTTEADLIDGLRTDTPSVEGVLADPRSLLLLLVGGPAATPPRKVDGTRAADAIGAGEAGGARGGEAGPKDDGRAEILACCHLRNDGGRAYFGMFAVRPGMQGSGLGRLVVAEAERWAGQEWRATEMWMTVISQRRDLIGWYERLGFERTGETQPFPYGDERFGRPKRPDLEFAVLSKPLP